MGDTVRFVISMPTMAATCVRTTRWPTWVSRRGCASAMPWMRFRWHCGRGSDQFVVRIPVGRRGSIELLRNGVRTPLKNCWNPFEESGLWPRTIVLEATVFDQRVQVAIDGRLLFRAVRFRRPGRAGVVE